MNWIFLKKEYTLGLVLSLAFGLFLFTVDQTSEQIVLQDTGIHFVYFVPAFTKLVYIVLLAVSLALLVVLNRNEEVSLKRKGNAYNSFIIWSVIAFFPGWTIHLYFLVKTIEAKGSFMALESQPFLYHCADITFIIGFCLAGVFILRPIIHEGKKA